MSGDTESNASIAGEKVRMVYLQAPVANTIAIALALTAYLGIQGLHQSRFATAWVVLLVLACALRVRLWLQHRSNPGQRTDAAWLQHYGLISGVIGLAWGALFISISANIEPYPLIVMLMLYLAITMEAYAALSAQLPAMFAQTAPPLLALNYALYQQPESVYRIFIPASLVFYLAAWLFARNHEKYLGPSQKPQAARVPTDERSLEQGVLPAPPPGPETANPHPADDTPMLLAEQLKKLICEAKLGFWEWTYQTGYQEVNDPWLSMLGLSRAEINNDVTDWFDRVHPEDRERVQEMINQAIADDRPYMGDFRMLHKDGSWVWIQGSGRVIEYENGVAQRLAGIHEEITRRKSLEQQIKYQAVYDTLTGLLNRRELLERLEIELNRAQRQDKPLTLVLLDIDQLGQIKDTLGHKAEEVLQGFASLLESQLRKVDICGRYADGEFLIVLSDTEIGNAIGIAERFRSLVEESDRLVAGLRLSITVSIGISTYPQHGETAEGLTEAARQALTHAQNSGQNCVATAVDGH